MHHKLLFALAIVGFLGGCSGLPSEGPSAMDISAEDIESLPQTEYIFVTIDANSANVAGQYRLTEFSRNFKVGAPGNGQRLGVGDRISVAIWEAGEDGLFSTENGKKTTVDAIVDENGMIFIPYAGRMRVAGRTVETVRQNIEANLVDKAIQPQVLVYVKGNVSNSAVIVGDISKPGRYPISLRGTRILDLIAGAGGSKYPTYETVVTLKRKDRTATTVLENLFDYPGNNIFLSPNDNILLAHAPRTFTAFGAVETTKEYPFESRTITLAEALARAGGLDDKRADAGGVFLFRFEDVEVARQLSDKVDEQAVSGYKVPVVYRLNFKDPKAFFYARYFELRDKDILYVANHPTAEFGKFLNIIQPGISSARSVDLITR
ncbi:polysaccharide biosynthesis/export family protein [Rhodobium gokarnense]|uniref:Polysaccharide export outer membrane protein n=1 Tax=Rhodobium gokarnense TaxID=364296 RepID=A0ABT3HAN7_9HYPH|nr:polysaccharide biosynthesis/export family protein [Rhodobium gokarnense]MCW2307465.1 polysaccharide export outer membrane protein [Rhodobium gokarnense]